MNFSIRGNVVDDFGAGRSVFHVNFGKTASFINPLARKIPRKHFLGQFAPILQGGHADKTDVNDPDFYPAPCKNPCANKPML